MKIFFEASVTGRKYFLENYRQIYAALQETKYQLFTYAFDSSPDKIADETIDEAESFYRKMAKMIRESDLGIFEVSYPSLGIGYEIALFMEQSKPVIALYTGSKRPYVLESIKNDKLIVVEYDLKSLKETLNQAINYAKEKMDSRFTLILPPELVGYLDIIAKNGTPRSEYIRNLIIKDRRQNI